MPSCVDSLVYKTGNVVRMSRMLKLAGFEECGKVDVLKLAQPFHRAPWKYFKHFKLLD